jgi:3-methyladenine DNA glycosylase AlkD
VTSKAVAHALASLERRGSKKGRDGMSRYGIVADKAFGTSVGDIRKLGKELGRNHALADPLWKTGWYEARMLVAFVAEPDKLTPAQMDRWAKDFDNWAICDTLCFHLFDRSPYAWTKVKKWSTSRDEFVKRAAFALIASVAGHNKNEVDAPFQKSLSLIERAASDERNFVKKGVSWALRGIGHRNKSLNAKATALAQRLAKSENATERWVGKDALRDITRPTVLRRWRATGRQSPRR